MTTTKQVPNDPTVQDHHRRVVRARNAHTRAMDALDRAKAGGHSNRHISQLEQDCAMTASRYGQAVQVYGRAVQAYLASLDKTREG